MKGLESILDLLDAKTAQVAENQRIAEELAKKSGMDQAMRNIEELRERYPAQVHSLIRLQDRFSQQIANLIESLVQNIKLCPTSLSLASLSFLVSNLKVNLIQIEDLIKDAESFATKENDSKKSVPNG